LAFKKFKSDLRRHNIKGKAKKQTKAGKNSNYTQKHGSGLAQWLITVNLANLEQRSRGSWFKISQGKKFQ
jgi:hypothetical protein